MKTIVNLFIAFAGIVASLPAFSTEPPLAVKQDPLCGLTEGTYTITDPEGGGHTEKDNKLDLKIKNEEKGMWTLETQSKYKPKFTAKGSIFLLDDTCDYAFMYGTVDKGNPLHTCEHGLLILGTGTGADRWKEIVINFIGPNIKCEKHLGSPATEAESGPGFLYHNGLSHGTKD